MKAGIIILFINLAFVAYAQDNNPDIGTGSPLNAVGLGRLNTASNVSSSSMGGLGVAIGLRDVINTNNPASYNTLGKTSFDVGLQNEILSLESPSTTGNSSSAYFKNAILAMPIPNSKFGFALGLLPFTSFKYKFSEEIDIDQFGIVENQYEGSGGMNEVLLGSSYRLKKDSINYLSIGLNASYLFGSINAETRIEGPEVQNPIDFRRVNNFFQRSFGLEYGLFYSRKLSDKVIFNFGGSFEHYLDSKTRFENLSETYRLESAGGIPTEIIRDTISLQQLDYAVTLSPRIRIGTSLLIDLADYNSKTKTQRLFDSHYIGLEYQTQDWTDYGDQNLSGEFTNHQNFIFGYQGILGQNAGKVFETWRIRLGANYMNHYVKPEVDETINEYGISFGVGVPFGTNGSLNLGVNIGERSFDSGLYKEQFTNLMLGITFSPSKFDRWFERPKIE
ncbi:MAG: hypothetical protein MRY83_05705 [Flavobacteriales bacterium]|nr:hypothetical protein [Flavobacteriales bacterium]